MKIKELLDSEDKWCQGHTAKTLDNQPVNTYSPDAVKFCLLGAIMKCYPESQHSEILRSIQKRLNGSIVCWNDDPRRTFSEVESLTDELGI